MGYMITHIISAHINTKVIELIENLDFLLPLVNFNSCTISKHCTEIQTYKKSNTSSNPIWKRNKRRNNFFLNCSIAVRKWRSKKRFGQKTKFLVFSGMERAQTKGYLQECSFISFHGNFNIIPSNYCEVSAIGLTGAVIFPHTTVREPSNTRAHKLFDTHTVAPRSLTNWTPIIATQIRIEALSPLSSRIMPTNPELNSKSDFTILHETWYFCKSNETFSLNLFLSFKLAAPMPI